MEKLSFASAYRTAAILAAFSRASASSEEGLRIRPSALVADYQPASRSDAPELAHLLLRNLYQAVIRVCSRRWRSRSVEGEADVHARWQAQSPTRNRDGLGRDLSRPHVISHFALCDEADPGEPG